MLLKIITGTFLLLVAPEIAAKQQAFYDCARNPSFIPKVGMNPPVAIDTQQSLLPGIVIREMQGQRRMFQHPSWRQTGNVGSTVRDEKGNVYAIPIPSVGLDTNPLAKRTFIYKIDSKTGILTKFSELPKSESPSQRNPFGTMGLAYDCDSKLLYVTSVSDSDPWVERGGIYTVSTLTGEVNTLLEGVDAIGIEVFDPGDGKRIYFGEARSSSVKSVSLRDLSENSRTAKPRHELSLLSLKNGNSTQVRKIRFEGTSRGGYTMVVTDTEFAYRLVADTSKRFRHYEFKWSDEASKWKFVRIR